MNVCWQAYTFPFHLFDIFDVRLLHVWSLAGRERARENREERGNRPKCQRGPKTGEHWRLTLYIRISFFMKG